VGECQSADTTAGSKEKVTSRPEVFRVHGGHLM
jgi:hypothetical protein